MATATLRKSSWLALLTTVTAQSSFWTYTSRFQDCYYTRDYSYTTYTSLSSCEIKSTVTPSASPYATTTPEYTYGEPTNVEVHYAWYTSGAVPESDLEPTYDYRTTRTTTTGRTTSTVHDFRMEVTYTAPSDCPTPFTFATNASVSVPSVVINQITPIEVITSTPTPTRRATYIYETWYLSAGQAPYTSEDDFYYTAYIEECSTPYQYSSYSYPTSTGRSSSGGYGGSGSGRYHTEWCYSYYGSCTPLKTWIIVIATVIPGLFLLGFLESYFWFRRLMLGKGCLRFGTVSWICISLWVACFTRSQSRRSPEDQKLLREKWRETSFGTAIKLWFKWGFRHRYPVPLLGQYSRNTVGIVPEGQPLPVPGMVQMNGTYPGGPPFPPGAFIPNGQGYYAPPPQGWAPPPNGQGYQMPPPGQAYMPGPNGVVQYYGEQSKDAPSVTTASVSPVYGVPQPAPSPVSPTVSPQPHPSQPNVAEVPAAAQGSTHATAPQPQAPAQLPTNKDSAT